MVDACLGKGACTLSHIFHTRVPLGLVFCLMPILLWWGLLFQAAAPQNVLCIPHVCRSCCISLLYISDIPFFFPLLLAAVSRLRSVGINKQCFRKYAIIILRFTTVFFFFFLSTWARATCSNREFLDRDAAMRVRMARARFAINVEYMTLP